MKEIKISLEKETLENIEGYAYACEITVEDFICGIISDFLRLQEEEMNEIYLNDDAASWIFPMGDY